MFMKGKFNVYLLLTFRKNLISQLETRVYVCNFMVLIEDQIEMRIYRGKKESDTVKVNSRALLEGKGRQRAINFEPPYVRTRDNV